MFSCLFPITPGQHKAQLSLCFQLQPNLPSKLSPQTPESLCETVFVVVFRADSQTFMSSENQRLRLNRFKADNAASPSQPASKRGGDKDMRHRGRESEWGRSQIISTPTFKLTAAFIAEGRAFPSVPLCGKYISGSFLLTVWCEPGRKILSRDRLWWI